MESVGPDDQNRLLKVKQAQSSKPIIFNNFGVLYSSQFFFIQNFDVYFVQIFCERSLRRAMEQVGSDDQKCLF